MKFFLNRNYEHKDDVHPSTKNNLIVKSMHSSQVPIRRLHTNTQILSKLHLSDTCLGHELSVEQQSYFKLLTESCFNGTDKKYSYALNRLSSDAALQPLVPRLLLFIAKSIQINIHMNDLDCIIRFLSILKMLTINTFISFDKYLHLILPTLLSCTLCIFDMIKNDCILSITDESNSTSHSTIWSMREQSSDLIAYFNRRYAIIPYFTERIISRIMSYLVENGCNTTYSIIYICIRTLLLIDNIRFNSFIINLFKNFRKEKTVEPDIDLDNIEQQIIFNHKIKELFKEHNLMLEDIHNY